MLADQLDYVIGVDTHRDAHALAVVAAAGGGVVLVEPALAACPRGYRRLLLLARAHAPGRRAFAIEGTGSYGAGLARFLGEQGERVLEVERPRRARRQRGKSDALDAVAAARSLLGLERLCQPRAGGRRAALQALLCAREGALNARRAALCQLRALIVTAPAPLREQLRTLTRARLLARCATLRPGASAGAWHAPGPAPARPAHPAAHGRGAGADRRDRGDRRAAGGAAAGRAGHRADLGRARARRLLTPRAAAFRGCLRPPRRRTTDPRQLRPGRAPSARPRRRPPAQPRPTHDRRQPPQTPPADDRLHRPSPTRGQKRPRGHPLPQALPRPPPLPLARSDAARRLKLIEASRSTLTRHPCGRAGRTATTVALRHGGRSRSRA
jgi:Transposase